jgi:hypothetical protein
MISAGVQPMNGPTGLIFAMRSRYRNQSNGTEAFFDEADTAFSGTDSSATEAELGSGYVANSDGASVGFGTTAQSGTNPGLLSPDSDATQLAYRVGRGMDTEDAEGLGEGNNGLQPDGFLNREGHRYCKVTCSESRIQP